MRNKFFIVTLLTAVLSSTAVWANVGPQSVKVTFNGNDAEGWVASSGGSVTSVVDGVANVQMAVQSSGKYRADFQYNTAGTFTMDKTKDVVWAIKLTGALPGDANAKKFEIKYKNAENSDSWINHPGAGSSGDITPSGTLNCADGGVIYYYDLATLAATQWSNVQDGTVTIQQIHYIFADATNLTTETAVYAVDWVASFASVNDLKTFQDWTDEQTDFTEPYNELCFRPKSDGSGYENGYNYNGFTATSFEGNYQARIFAVEYFLVEDFSLENIYTFQIVPSATNNAAVSVWDFPYQVNAYESASDMNTKAQTVVGFVPGGSGDQNTPIATATCTDNKWTLTIPAYKLTALATVGTKTLVGMLVTTRDLTTNSGAKFASSANTDKAHPSFSLTGTNPVVNITQSTASADLATAVSAAADGDVLELRDDVTISGSRLEITKNLTIQGATGEEKIICGVGASTLMVLANGNSSDYTVTFKDLIVDGNGATRTIQTFDTNNKGKICFDGVTITNVSYSAGVGDVKCAGPNIILKGVNTFPVGIVLNSGKRVDGKDATHTSAEPVNIILASDYAEDYAIVLCSGDPSLYNISALDAAPWYLYDSESGSCGHELKGRKIAVFTIDEATDNSSALSTNNGKRANVTLNRTIVCDGDYATFCVPFDIPAEQVASQLGEGTVVLRMKRVESGATEDVFVFDDDVTDIEAGVPYLILPPTGSDITSMTFSDVVIDNTATPSVYGSYQFVPVFSPTTIADATQAAEKSVVYLGAGNQLYWAANGANLNGFRAYFKVPATASSAPARPMRIGHAKDQATGMEENKQSDMADPCTKIIRNGEMLIIRNGAEYSVMGQRLR